MNLLKDITSFLKSAKKPLVVLLGPTASGKTSLSFKIAHHIDGEIISTDSRQIYRGLEIGSDIIAPEDQEGVPHHMLAIAEPDEPVTLTDYRKMALESIDKIYENGNIPMLVGGTGLYISSIIENYELEGCPPDKKLRKQLEEEVKEHGPEYIHNKLKKLDPEAAKDIHPNNIRYVIRAIEINLTTGKNKKSTKKGSDFDLFMIGIDWPREQLYKRVGQRVEIQVKRGLVDEVKALVEKNYAPDLPAMSSLGAKEIVPFIKGEMELEECLEILRRSTRKYAKRQMTWFRRYDSVKWLSPEELEDIVNS
ncbi:tRNA (adenosine(37)-N6)-dimethylallyltransferase MiaA [Candidatus Peregrinibacteria bacterium]|jgi:tRNA dimethylallyltransferase|nr:tRNA (adenosine(37)-N6)-dimethylallyltransferase MiaA [Candidatus Peregrinibacteria bacterium]MBT7736843.1 tRNA (adenosine(37)-N6)-dimethylallyltransferase MiaA [Candidatus Peregrinibacteria bacterium]